MPLKPGSRKRLYGYNNKTKGKRMENRPRSIDEYHTARWTRESRRFRESNPFCVRCKAKGLLVPSQVTDHIIPVPIHPDFWDKSNWQALCTLCNIAKGNEDKKLIRKFNLNV